MFKELNSIIIILTAIALAFVLALWISLIIWTLRDIRLRTKDRLFRFLAVVSVVVFNFPGYIIYLILRPKLTFTDYYQSALEEEALLQSLEGFGTCSNCGHQTKSGWIFCPYCETKLVTECVNCNTFLQLDWVACPQCGTPVIPMQEQIEEQIEEPDHLESDIEPEYEDGEPQSEELETDQYGGDMLLEEEEFDSFQED